MRKTIWLLVIFILLSGMFSGCGANRVYPEANTWTMTEVVEQDEYTSIEELYRNIPANITEPESRVKWMNEYEGTRVKGIGKAVSGSIHPQAGKVFFIITLASEKNPANPSTTQIALFVEDAYNISLGEKEGSFLVNDSHCIQLGDDYEIEGRVSGYSGFDPELLSEGYSNLIIVGVQLADITALTLPLDVTSTQSGTGIVSVKATPAVVPEINTPKDIWTSNGPPGASITAMVIDPGAPNTLYLGTFGGGIFKSTNSGVDWHAVNAGLSHTEVADLEIDPATPGTLYAASTTWPGGVFKTTNGGESWFEISNGLANAGRLSSLAIDPKTPSIIYAGAEHSGLFKSIDGGANWTTSNNGLNENGVLSMVIDPLTPTTLYAGTMQGGVYKSTDSGGNWREINAGITNSWILSLAIDPLRPTTLYAVTFDGGVFKSTNSGENWNPINNGLPDNHVLQLTVNPAKSDTMYACTQNNGLFQSTNGGESWSPINTGLNVTTISDFAIDPVSPVIQYAATPNGILRSSDNGETWEASKVGPSASYVRSLAVDPLTPSIIYAGMDAVSMKCLPMYLEARMAASYGPPATMVWLDQMLERSQSIPLLLQ